MTIGGELDSDKKSLVKIRIDPWYNRIMETIIAVSMLTLTFVCNFVNMGW